MAIPAELPKQVESIIRKHLLRAFPSAVIFDPILVEPMIGWQGDDNLRITVVCDGDTDLVDDGAKLNALEVAMWPDLEAAGFYNIPVVTYSDKDEWEEWNNLPEEQRWAELMGMEPGNEITDELGTSD